MSDNGEPADATASGEAPPASVADIAERLGTDPETVREAVAPTEKALALPDVNQHEFSRLCDILQFAEENTVTTEERAHIKDLKKKLIHDAEEVSSELSRPIPFYVIESAIEGATEADAYAVVRSDNDYRYARSLDEANSIAADMRGAAATLSPDPQSVQVIDLQEPEA